MAIHNSQLLALLQVVQLSVYMQVTLNVQRY